MATVLVFTFLTIIFYIINYLWNIYTYWNRKGIAGPVPLPVVGNYGSVLFGLKTEAEMIRNIYEKYPNERYVGIYQGLMPILILRDPEIIKKMFTDDFENFGDRYVTNASKRFNKSIFIMNGDNRWKLLRATLMPSFTKLKLKNMLHLMKPAIKKYLDFVEYLVENKIDYEFRELEMKFSLEAIVGIVTGAELNNFQKESKLQKVATKTINLEVLTFLRTMEMINPHIMKPFVVGYSEKTYNVFEEFIMPLMKDRPITESEGIQTFLDIFVNIKDSGLSKKINNNIVETDFSDDDIIQLCATLCLAGIEALSGSVSLLMHELARDQTLQNKCFQEVKTTLDKYDGEATFESLSELKYVGIVIDEILRKTSVSYVDRKCACRYQIPDSNITIDEGIYVYVPLQGLQNDPKYFPNPEKFDPERFLPENIVKRPCYVYNPFGVGPRQCLGKPLGKMMALIAVAVFLYKYKVVPSNMTPDKIVYCPVTRTHTAKTGVWTTIQRR